MLFRRLVFTLKICSYALAKCLPCERSDQTVHHAMKTTERRARVLSPVGHMGTQLLEPSGLQTESGGYLQPARTNAHFIFVPPPQIQKICKCVLFNSPCVIRPKKYSRLITEGPRKRLQDKVMHGEDGQMRGREKEEKDGERGGGEVSFYLYVFFILYYL